MKINCIIVDDEPLARKGLAEYIADVDYLELRGQAENAISADKLLVENRIELLFLDIQMPKVTGLQYLKKLNPAPMVIFTTAYPNYALEAYELDVLDYLVKPISFERFEKACSKAKELFDLKNLSSNAKLKTDEYFFIKCKERFEKIMYADILYVEAMENYVIFYTEKGKYISYLTFKAVESYLPQNKFLKIHKSFIISVSKVQSVGNDEVVVRNKSLSISRSLKDIVMKTLLDNNLLKR